MPNDTKEPTMTANPATTDHTYTVSRTVDAPVGKVWEIWTTVAHYESWFHAVPGSVELDVRPGGAWRATLCVPDGSEYPMSGSYAEVVENRRLVTAMDIPGREPAVTAMELTDLDGRTQLTVTQACQSQEEHDMAKEGTELLLEWCADYLARN
jgi:uncharacterized protein YndB with AHSA1/START domain